MTRFALVVFSVLVCASDAFAQAAVFEAAERIYGVFTAPVHPTLEPVAPGGGVTGGIGFSPEEWFGRRLGVDARASVSTKKYWATDVAIWWQAGSRLRLEAFGSVRDMRQLGFYGIGQASRLEDQANVRLIDRAVGGLGWLRPVSWMAVGGRLEGLWPDVRAGTDSDVPSIEDVFAPASVPGFRESATFLRAQAFTNINYPSGLNEAPRSGGDYQVAYSIFADQAGTASYSFGRFDLEMQQRIGVGPPPFLLTLHLLLSDSDPKTGHAVPFYMMPTLGGAKNLLRFGEALIGGDQNTATLRGFADFRFRDRTLLLLQAEFRFPIWAQVNGSVFADAGQVADRIGRLATNRLRRNVGFSISVMRVNSTVVRLDFGFGGGEGFEHFITPGGTLAP